MFLVIATICFSLTPITDAAVGISDKISEHYENTIGKPERSKRSTDTIDTKSTYLAENGGSPDTDFDTDDDTRFQNVYKRPFVLSTGMFGKRLRGNKINKRPLVIGGGYTFGKRSQSDPEARPYVYDGYGSIVKRPFVLGSGFKLGKQDIPKYFLNSYVPQYDNQEYIEKRPFVLSGGYKFGKRNKNKGHGLQKRPFVLGSGFRYGKRSDYISFDKRPFVLGSGSGFGKRVSKDNMMAKRPFVLGGYGKRTGNGQNGMVEKRPFVLGGYGKREETDVDKRPFILGGYGKREENDVDKRPFVFGGYGKREQTKNHHFEKRPFVLGNYGKRENFNSDGKNSENDEKAKSLDLDGFQTDNDEDENTFSDGDSERKHILEGLLHDLKIQSSDIDKRPFVLGGYGKRESTKDKTVAKRPFVLGNYGKRDDDDEKRSIGFQKFERQEVSREGHVKKRPFSHGWSFGKRSLPELTDADLQLLLQFMEYNYSKNRGDQSRKNSFNKNSKNSYEINKFVSGANDKDTYRYDLKKRPFVLGGPYAFGRVYELGKRSNTREYEHVIFKRPFILSSPNSFSTKYQFGKRSRSNVLTKDTNDDEVEDIRMQKRPFVLGGGRFIFRKRPYTPVSQYQIGKRDTPIFNNDELSDYVNDFTMDKRGHDINRNRDKRPFVFGGGPKFGKRSNVYEYPRNINYSDHYQGRTTAMNKHHFGIRYDNQYGYPMSAMEFDKPQQYIR